MKNMKLEVGDKIVQFNRNNVIARYTIERVTKTVAFSKNSQFKFKIIILPDWSDPKRANVIKIPQEKWTCDSYELITEEVEQEIQDKIKRQKRAFLVENWRRFLNVQRLSDDNIDSIIQIFELEKEKK